MKKLVMLTAATILGMSAMGLSQADEVPDAAQTAVDAGQSQANAEPATTPADDAELMPQDPPNVQAVLKDYPNLAARIQPYGTVCYEGQDCDITLMSAGASTGDGPRDGQTIYNQVCQTCHASGLLGSPMFGDAAAWAPRIAQGSETLYDHAINGIGDMPAKGGADIPDEEVINAVDYMVENSQ